MPTLQPPQSFSPSLEVHEQKRFTHHSPRASLPVPPSEVYSQRTTRRLKRDLKNSPMRPRGGRLNSLGPNTVGVTELGSIEDQHSYDTRRGEELEALVVAESIEGTSTIQHFFQQTQPDQQSVEALEQRLLGSVADTLQEVDLIPEHEAG